MKRLYPVLLAALAACSHNPPPAGPAAPSPTITADLRWAVASAEHRALYLQVYRSAEEHLAQVVAGRSPGSWAVILDADETILDNTPYQRSLAETGAVFSNESWNAWVRSEAAPALPGAAAFIREVKARGGRVVVVTNRAEAVCAETRANLDKLDIPVDGVLCQPARSDGDKNPRFRAVAQGTGVPGLPPLDVVLWVGDNIRDFPGMDQGVRFAAPAALSEFGRRYFLLPNPMYGSWSSNPLRPDSTGGQIRR